MRIEDIKVGQKVKILRSCNENKCEFYEGQNCPFVGNIGTIQHIDILHSRIGVGNFGIALQYPSCIGFQACNLELIEDIKKKVIIISKYAEFINNIEKKG